MSLQEKVSQLRSQKQYQADCLWTLQESLKGGDAEYSGKQAASVYRTFQHSGDMEMASVAMEVMRDISRRVILDPHHLNLTELDVNMTLNEYTEKLRNRLPRAYELGWSIHRDTISPPDHFVCAKRHWAASYQCVLLDDTFVSVPHWFWDESVFTTGQ